MTSPDISPHTHEDTDPEDIALCRSLSEMQEIVTGHLAATGLSIDDLSEADQQTLVDKVAPYLEFELQHAEGIWAGMPFIATGVGGILTANETGIITGAQGMSEGDSVTGIVDDVQAFPVPSLECMRESIEEGEANIPLYTQSFSAVVTLQKAVFRTLDAQGSTVMHDLGSRQVIVPVIYGMHMEQAGLVEI